MFTKHEIKLEMFVAVYWSYGKWCISIVRSTIPLVDQSMAKVWILILSYELTSSFVEFFSGLKFSLVRHNLR